MIRGLSVVQNHAVFLSSKIATVRRSRINDVQR